MILSWRLVLREFGPLHRLKSFSPKQKISVEAKNSADKSEKIEEPLKSSIICPTGDH